MGSIYIHERFTSSGSTYPVRASSHLTIYNADGHKPFVWFGFGFCLVFPTQPWLVLCLSLENLDYRCAPPLLVINGSESTKCPVNTTLVSEIHLETKMSTYLH